MTDKKLKRLIAEDPQFALKGVKLPWSTQPEMGSTLFFRDCLATSHLVILSPMGEESPIDSSFRSE
jgi:hypothetical protein